MQLRLASFIKFCRLIFVLLSVQRVPNYCEKSLSSLQFKIRSSSFHSCAICIHSFNSYYSTIKEIKYIPTRSPNPSRVFTVVSTLVAVVPWNRIDVKIIESSIAAILSPDREGSNFQISTYLRKRVQYTISTTR